MHPHSSYQRPKRSLSLTSSNSTSTQGSQPFHVKPKSNSLSSKLFHPHSKSPTPVDIPDTSSRHSMAASQPQDIPRSAPKMSYFDDHHHHSTSPVQMSPNNSSPRSPKEYFGTKRAPTPTRKTSDDYRRYSGTVNHCGRHSNDWLFGGFSVRDTVRDGFEKLRHNDDKES